MKENFKIQPLFPTVKETNRLKNFFERICLWSHGSILMSFPKSKSRMSGPFSLERGTPKQENKYKVPSATHERPAAYWKS